jgi:hypothetical protein
MALSTHWPVIIPATISDERMDDLDPAIPTSELQLPDIGQHCVPQAAMKVFSRAGFRPGAVVLDIDDQ